MAAILKSADIASTTMVNVDPNLRHKVKIANNRDIATRAASLFKEVVEAVGWHRVTREWVLQESVSRSPAMPSKSKKQAKFMRAVAHGWKPRGRKGPSIKVAREFMKADQQKKRRKRGK
jgi:hypothetical protein